MLSIQELDTSLTRSYWTQCALPRIQDTTSLRIWISFQSVKGLQQAFEAISEYCQAPQLAQAILQVNYQLSSLSSQAYQLHSTFQQAHPKCSTYLPLCLPNAHNEELRLWTSPEHCEACIFREGQRCGGLNSFVRSHSSKHASSKDPSALIDPWRNSTQDVDLQMDRDQWFGEPPFAYWYPNQDFIDKIHNLITNNGCKSFWDLGAGNGVLGALLCPSSCTLVSIEPLTHYRLPPQALAWRGTALDALDAMHAKKIPRPDVLFISWPSPTISFKAEIRVLLPQFIIRATDLAGFCGARNGHYALWWSEGQPLQCWRPSDCITGYDDLTPLEGYELIFSQEVDSLYDARAANRSVNKQGIVSIFQKSDLKNSIR